LKDVSSLNEKVVIDLNNSAIPADFEFDPIDRSHAEKLQGQIPKARVVKAYNTFPQEVIELSPDKIRPYRVAAFIAGDDQKARETVLALSRELGLEAIDCGPLKRARLLEGLADFIRFLIIGGGRPNANFSIVDVLDTEEQRLGGRQPSKLR
jgi:8-hydroxy-5-deazaflavin:NADPH oxidoreductase